MPTPAGSQEVEKESKSLKQTDDSLLIPRLGRTKRPRGQLGPTTAITQTLSHNVKDISPHISVPQRPHEHHVATLRPHLKLPSWHFIGGPGLKSPQAEEPWISVSLINNIYKLDPARYATREFFRLCSGPDLLPSPFLETQESDAQAAPSFLSPLPALRQFSRVFPISVPSSPLG